MISYASGRCGMAANRDCRTWSGNFCVWLQPATPADDTLLVGRVTGTDGSVLATLVNYACHPTTLAWDNQLISPDYVGALRETVEEATGAPCFFMLGVCGELGPVHGFVGDTAVADSNGREVAYAALCPLQPGPPAHDFAYTGPVVSGPHLGHGPMPPRTPNARPRPAISAAACLLSLWQPGPYSTGYLSAELEDLGKPAGRKR